MRQLLILLLIIMPIIANANIPFTRQDLIGQWECKVLEDEYFRSMSDIEYRDDGMMTEQTVLYKWSENEDFYQIDTLKMLSKWQLTNDKIRYYDSIIQSYVVDMPNYDNIAKLSNHKKEVILMAKAMMERSEIEKMTSDTMIGRIRFLDKDTYIFAFEGVDDDFPTDIENNHCKRKR